MQDDEYAKHILAGKICKTCAYFFNRINGEEACAEFNTDAKPFEACAGWHPNREYDERREWW